jgi:tetratricopeptide (TPR) repeat protein
MHKYFILLCILAFPAWGLGQSASALFERDRAQAHSLMREGKYEEAGKILSGLVKKAPEDFDVLFHGGYAYFLQAESLSDVKMQKRLLKQARGLFEKAKAAGYAEPLIDELLSLIAPDGTKMQRAFTPHLEADASMRKGESAFTRKQFDEARQHYSKALELDPKLYAAAVFLGDIDFVQSHHPEAIAWFEKAVAIDPDQETAYRYWADALARSGQIKEAGDKYIQAVVANPTSQLAWRALDSWANATRLNHGHPAGNFARATVAITDGKVELGVDPQGGIFSMAYGIMRAAPMTEALEKHTRYQHSLETEMKCMEGILEIGESLLAQPDQAKERNVTQSMLNDVRAVLRLKADHLLEAWIFLARTEPDLAKDYATYRRGYRDQLFRYLHDVYLGLPPAPRLPVATDRNETENRRLP